MPNKITIETIAGADNNNNILRGHWVIDASSRTWDDSGTWIDTRTWDEGKAPLIPQNLPYYL